MKISLLQLNSSWNDTSENIGRAQLLLDQTPDTDIIILPEMWNTGFMVDPRLIAPEASFTALAWMKQVATERQCAVCGSMAVSHPSDGTFRNRLYFVTPHGVTHYDKRHLFAYGGEDQHFTPGRRHVIVDYKGRSFLLLTCYDLRFPVWSRYGRAGHYDAILLVANWPDKRSLAWQALCRARAVENQCFFVGVNRVGDDPRCHYVGQSIAVDCRANVLASGRDNIEESITVDLDFALLDKDRQRFNVLNDADSK